MFAKQNHKLINILGENKFVLHKHSFCEGDPLVASKSRQTKATFRWALELGLAPPACNDAFSLEMQTSASALNCDEACVCMYTWKVWCSYLRNRQQQKQWDNLDILSTCIHHRAGWTVIDWLTAAGFCRSLVWLIGICTVMNFICPIA